MRDHSIDIEAAGELVDAATTKGSGYFYAAVNGQLAGFMVIADPIKPGSRAAVDELEEAWFHGSAYLG